MTPEPLDETYFKWLFSQVANVRSRKPSISYTRLIRQLFVSEFVWIIRNDDNRVADGIELRSLFLSEHQGLEVPVAWMRQGCSFLEMLIALSGRLAFQSEGVSPAEWFWHLVSNIDIAITDEQYLEAGIGAEQYVHDRLVMVNNRSYDYSGRGGLFPLSNPKTDQTKAEIWSQMNYYLIERS